MDSGVRSNAGTQIKHWFEVNEKFTKTFGEPWFFLEPLDDAFEEADEDWDDIVALLWVESCPSPTEAWK